MSEPTPEEVAWQITDFFMLKNWDPRLSKTIAAALRAARLAGWEEARDACKKVANKIADDCFEMDKRGTSHAEAMGQVASTISERFAALTPPGENK